MKIIMVGHGHGGSYFYDDSNIGSGWENLCPLLDGHWYEFDDAAKLTADLVLYIGTGQSVRALAERGRPPGWGKVVMLQEAGGSMFHPYYIDWLISCRFDAFLVYSTPLTARFEAFGKPVIPVLNAYPFHKLPHLRAIPKDSNRLALYLQRYSDPTANVLGTLAMVQRLPLWIDAVCWTDEADAPGLCRIVEGCRLEQRIEVRPTQHWPDYMAELATCGAVASMDGRQTWGRMDLDAALVGIRCIGPYTAAKAELFPECIVEVNDVDAAVELTLRALESPRHDVPQQVKQRFEHRAVDAYLRGAVATALGLSAP